MNLFHGLHRSTYIYLHTPANKLNWPKWQELVLHTGSKYLWPDIWCWLVISCPVFYHSQLLSSSTSPYFSIVHYKFIPQSCPEHCVSNWNTIVATKTNPNFLSTLLRKIQVNEYLRLRQLSTGNLEYLHPKKMSYLTPSLTLVEEVRETTPATENISYMLKQQANTTAASPTTYMMYLQRFNEGTVEQWITLQGKNIWRFGRRMQ
jgi:hypothetical protein